MKIISIETSCDDTAISIMEAKGGVRNASFKVLANASNSQIKIHLPYGGVYPALAKREHAKNLPILLEEALKQANLIPRLPLQGEGAEFLLSFQERVGVRLRRGGIDLIAVTYGPGLEMCLWEGITFAKDLAKKWDCPLVPTNHMEGHVVSVFGKNKGGFKIPLQKGGQAKIKFPMLSLLVSGRHTQLVLSKSWMNYEIIGKTLDDAVGEAFDKVARMLGLPYPGGPEISKLAEELREKEKQSLRGVSQSDGPRGSAVRARTDSDPAKIGFSFSLPRPMLHSKNFDFSFSGLKTAVLYLIRDLAKKHSNILQNDKMIKAIALEFENAAIECLTYKTKKAIEKYGIKTLIVAGGVAANKHLRSEMQKITTPDPSSTRGGGYEKIKLLFPTLELSGDNSLMIGIAGYLNFVKNKKKVPKLGSIKAVGNLRL